MTNDDTISRQAAIDAFYVQSDDDGWWTGTAQDMEELLKGLPSAQPKSTEQIKWERDTAVEQLKELGYGLGEKIIHCKECKHFEYDHPYIIQGIPILGHEVCNAWGDGCKTDENGYCFMAERRTDEQVH